MYRVVPQTKRGNSQMVRDPQASKIVSTATCPAGQVTWKSTCPAEKPICPAFLNDNIGTDK